MAAAKSRLEYVECKTGSKKNAHTVLFALRQQLAENIIESSDTADQEEENVNATHQKLFSTLVAKVENGEGRGVVLGEENIHLFNVDVDISMSNVEKREFSGACCSTLVVDRPTVVRLVTE